MVNREKLAAVFFAAAMVLGLAATAGAADGTIEINQAKVLASGGFPYVISATASYRLTGNLTVPGSTDGIDVTAANVTIDLNGFAITTASGLVGIKVSEGLYTVENGTVNGFSTGGVEGGFFGIVKNLHADGNGQFGINVGDHTVVEGCTANLNASPSGVGIVCFSGCAISGNTASQNIADGIDCTGTGCVISSNAAYLNSKVGINCSGSGCAISGNTAASNGSSGISCGGSGCLVSGNAVSGNALGISAHDTTTGYGGNVLMNTTNHSGGTSLGHNLCSGIVC